MVHEQIVSRGIKDARMLQVMGKVPRHLFVKLGLVCRFVKLVGRYVWPD